MEDQTGRAPESAVTRTVLTVSFIDALGSGLFLASAPVLAVTALQHSAPVVGLALGLNGVAALIASVPLGRISDRHTPRSTLIVLHLVRGILVAGFGLLDAPVAFVALFVGLGAAEGGVGPLMQSLVAQHLSAGGRVRRMAQVRTMRNAGFCAGSLVAAALMLLGPRPAALAAGLVNALSFLVGAALLRTVPAWRPGTEPETEAETPGATAGPAGPRRARRLVLLVGALSGVLSVHATLLTVALPLWIVQTGRLPAYVAPLCIAVNAVVVILVQVRVSASIDGRPALAVFSMAAVPLAVSVLLFGLPPASPAAVLAAAVVAVVLLLTVAELVHSVGAWEAGFRLSAPNERGRDLARFNLGLLGQEVTAPIILTLLLTHSSPYAWTAIAAVVLISGRMADRLMRAAPGHAQTTSTQPANAEEI